MINRRRPIQSIVAGRKMFSNGGVVPPPMGAPPMGILNSSPELAQAASFSQPPPTLVDSMVNEATAGYGQGLQDSTAMNAAPVTMAHGGLASEDMMAQGFFNGGVQYGTNPNRPPRPLGSPRISYRGQSVSDDDLGAAWASGEGRGVVRPVARNARVLPVLGPAIQAEEPAANAMIQQSNKFLNQAGPNTGNYTSLDNMQFLSPYKLDPSLDFDVQTFSATGDIKPMNLNALINEDNNVRGNRWFDVPLLNEPGRQQGEAPAAALLRQAAGAASVATKTLMRSLTSLWNAQFDGETADKYNAEGWGGKAFMVASMIESQPGFKEEIEALTTELITNNPNISPTELKNAVAFALSNKYEIGPHAEAINKAGIKAEREGVIADLTSGESLTAEEYEKMKAAEAAEIAESDALTEGENFSNLFYGPGGEGLAIDEEDRVRAEADEAIDFLKYGVTDETGMPRDPTAAEAGELARIKEEERKAAAAAEARFREVGLADETGMPRDPTADEAKEIEVAEDAIRQREAESDIAALTEGEEFATLTDELKAAENLALSRFGSKANMKPAEAKRTLENYVDEFKKVAPEYEGMSDSEKWFAIAEAGLRIMAGQSPNAITNIAKGLKGLGSELAKDAKEKRAYDRQVGLSAAKYGLQAVAKDRADLKAAEKDDNKLYSEVFRVRTGETVNVNGKKYSGGQTVILTVGDIRNQRVDINKLVTEDSVLEAVKAKQKNLENSLDLLKDTVVDPNKFQQTSKQYIKDSMRVRTNVATRGLLNNALVLLTPREGSRAVGVKATAKNAILALANAFGQKKYAMSVFDGLDTQKKFSDFTNRAVTTQIEGLINEGGKITDQERELAKEIGGSLAKGAFSGVFEDEEVLRNRIRAFSAALDRDSTVRLKSMALAEQSWANSYNTIAKGRVSYGEMLRRSRGPLRSPAAPKALKTLPGSINWKDIINVDKKGKVLGYKSNWKTQ